MTSRCEQLEDYLAGLLDEPEVFAEHLTECSTCAAAVREAREVNALVRGISRREPIPFDLTARVNRRIRTARRRRLVGAMCGVAASMVGVWLLPSRPTKPIEPPTATIADAGPRVEFGDDVMAVPVATDSPRVTFFWVYPNLAVGPDPALTSEGSR